MCAKIIVDSTGSEFITVTEKLFLQIFFIWTWTEVLQLFNRSSKLL